ncbi:DUF1589 domain-containing protein [Rhodopirellula islandica]
MGSSGRQPRDRSAMSVQSPRQVEPGLHLEPLNSGESRYDG